jgi:hypothetical protein
MLEAVCVCSQTDTATQTRGKCNFCSKADYGHQSYECEKGTETAFHGYIGRGNEALPGERVSVGAATYFALKSSWIIDKKASSK